MISEGIGKIMIINKKTICYFSGTGNSLQISKDIASQLRDTELISIPSIINNNEIKVQSEYIGIIFPVYMFGIPLILDDFIKKLNINKSTYVFAVTNYGGLPGNTLKQVNDLLENKGTKLNAGFAINMPGNYIVEYGSRSIKSQNKAFEKEKIKVKQIAQIIKEKKDYKYEKSKLLIDRVLTPIMYKKIKAIHSEDKSFWVKDNCTGCGLCEKLCGVNNIEIKEGKPIWKNKCEQCLACIQYCPNEAIEYGKKTIGRKRYRNPNIDIQELIKGV